MVFNVWRRRSRGLSARVFLYSIRPLERGRLGRDSNQRPCAQQQNAITEPLWRSPPTLHSWSASSVCSTGRQNGRQPNRRTGCRSSIRCPIKGPGSQRQEDTTFALYSCDGWDLSHLWRCCYRVLSFWRRLHLSMSATFLRLSSMQRCVQKFKGHKRKIILKATVT